MKNIKLINGYPFIKYSREAYSTDIMTESASFFKEWMDTRRTCRDFSDKPVDKNSN